MQFRSLATFHEFDCFCPLRQRTWNVAILLLGLFGLILWRIILIQSASSLLPQRIVVLAGASPFRVFLESGGVKVKSLAKQRGQLQVNGKTVDSAIVHSGDFIQAGRVTFRLETFPSGETQRIIYRHRRSFRDALHIGRDRAQNDIVITDDPSVAAKHFSIKFDEDSFTVKAHHEVVVLSRNRVLSIDVDATFQATEVKMEERISFGNTVLSFPYRTNQGWIQLSVVEQTSSQVVYQAKLIKQFPDTGSIRIPGKGLLSIVETAKQVKRARSLTPFLGVAGFWVGLFFVWLLVSKARRFGRCFLLIGLIWLGDAVLIYHFGLTRPPDRLVESDFLERVQKAIDKQILYLDVQGEIHQKDRNALNPDEIFLLDQITTKGRDITPFVEAYNTFVRSQGKEGQGWFVVDGDRLVKLREHAVTIVPKAQVHLTVPRGRILDQDGRSIPKLIVLEGGYGLTPQSQIWLTQRQRLAVLRKDIITIKADEEEGEFFTQGNARILYKKSRILIDNRASNRPLTWYTKLAIGDELLPTKRKLGAYIADFFQYDGDRLVLGEVEIRYHQNDGVIKAGTLLLLGGGQSPIELTAEGVPVTEGVFSNHIAITLDEIGEYALHNVGRSGEGIEVNGLMLPAGESRSFDAGDMLRIGDLLLEFVPDSGGVLAGNRRVNGKVERFSPSDLNLCQTVGYYRDELKGGLEKIFDSVLTQGEDVVTTIDDDLQRIVVDELRRALEEFDVTNGAVLALDAKTGEVRAIASEPSFNPNSRSSILEAWRKDRLNHLSSPLTHRALHAIYPPGSTFKVVVLSAARELENDLPLVKRFLSSPLTQLPIVIRNRSL